MLPKTFFFLVLWCLSSLECKLFYNTKRVLLIFVLNTKRVLKTLILNIERVLFKTFLFNTKTVFETFVFNTKSNQDIYLELRVVVLWYSGNTPGFSHRLSRFDLYLFNLYRTVQVRFVFLQFDFQILLSFLNDIAKHPRQPKTAK